MKKSLPHLVSLLFITCLLWSVVLTPVHAQDPGWSGDENLSFLLELDGVSAIYSNESSPTPIDLAVPLELSLTIATENNITLHSGAFEMVYMSFPIINQPFDFDDQLIPSGIEQSLLNESLDLGAILSMDGIAFITGNVYGMFSFTYSLLGENTTTTVSEDFVLRIGPEGIAAVGSVTGMVTVGFTVFGIFSLLMALDDFQQGIFAAGKMRGAKRGSDVGIFPKQVVLRRKPKKGKDSETISKEDLIARVSSAAAQAWDGRRCPKCGKKWGKDKEKCAKCTIDRTSALTFFSLDIAEYAPKALNVVKPKSKVTVGKFSKKLRLKPDKGGALAAALVDMGIFQTKTVKVPLKKVSMAGLSLAGSYWSWMQMFGGATPDLVVVALTTTAGLVISVIIGYLMNFLARIPALGYDQ
ncbi:MAG: hypothetical protein ACTSUB_10160 [Candidatus Thorarchaeota archaeon]